MFDPQSVILQIELLSEVKTAWLQNDVPLWAFLIALLTKPYMWAAYAKTAVANRFGQADDRNKNTADTDD